MRGHWHDRTPCATSGAPTDPLESPELHTPSTHRHTDLYHQFLELTESKIAAFLETKGWTPEKFYKECREAVEQSEKSRRYSPDSFFINTLLACSEFDQFVMMMTRVQESLREAKTGLKQACEAVLKVLDDDNEVSKDQVDEIRTRCRTTLEWLDEHPDATMPELLDVQTAHDLKLIEVFGDAESDDKAAIGRLRRAAFES